MKVIVSHDVDHLFRDDHYFDLIYPKLWIRESLNRIKGHIGSKEWKARMLSPFQKNRNHIDELMVFEKMYLVPSTFFFGMAKGLGMSYKPEKAIPVIRRVRENGFEVGIHGINFKDYGHIKNEFDKFNKLIGQCPQSIRMHYVRYDRDTFTKLSDCGYLVDSSEFDKSMGTCIKSPYKVGKLWEFPLTIMDVYLPYPFDKAKERTLELLETAQKNRTEYVTILFHDYLYCDAWIQRKKWFEWLIKYLASSTSYEFISFIEAVRELEKGHE